MTEQEIAQLDKVNNLAALKTVDAKVNYVYNAFDMGLSRMNEVREYFINNLKQ